MLRHFAKYSKHTPVGGSGDVVRSQQSVTASSASSSGTSIGVSNQRKKTALREKSRFK